MNGYIDQNGNYYEAERNITGATEVPRRQPPLAQFKAEKLAELRHLRDAACTANVTVQGKTFTAEPETQTSFTRLADLVRRGKASRLSAILDADGNTVAVNPALLEAIEDAIADNTEAAWNKYGALVQQVNAATTVEHVNVIAW